FAAAGNDGSSQPFYPAAYPEVNSVAALAPSNNGPVSAANGTLASYSNYGPTVDMAALGTGIVPWGSGAYLISGTSTATAYLAGTAAAIAAKQHIPPYNAAQAMSSSSAFHYSGPK